MNKNVSNKNADRLAAILSRMKDTDVYSGEGNTKFLKLPEGVTRIRILPEVGDMPFGEFYQEVGMHYLPDDTREYCPAFTTRGAVACPICEVCNTLYRSGSAVNKELAKKLRVSKQYWMNVIDRGDEDAGPQILAAGPMIFNYISAHVSDPEFGDITDPDDGMDASIDRVGLSMDTKYSVRCGPRTSPISADPAQANEWLDAASDLTVGVLTGDEEEDAGIMEDYTIWVKNYDMMAAVYSPEALLSMAGDADDGGEAVVKEAPVQRAMRQRRSKR